MNTESPPPLSAACGEIGSVSSATLRTGLEGRARTALGRPWGEQEAWFLPSESRELIRQERCRHRNTSNNVNKDMWE